MKLSVTENEPKNVNTTPPPVPPTRAGVEIDDEDLFFKLLTVCDKNSNLDANSKNHNEDFCRIAGDKIETTRSFALKAMRVFSISYELMPKEEQPAPDANFLITIRARVYDREREAIEIGACSTAETKTSGARAYHDAVTRAGTRALKRGLAGLIGREIINRVINALFPADMPAVPPENAGLMTELKKMLGDACRAGILTTIERNDLYNTARAVADNTAQLESKYKLIKLLIEEKTNKNQNGGQDG